MKKAKLVEKVVIESAGRGEVWWWWLEGQTLSLSSYDIDTEEECLSEARAIAEQLGVPVVDENGEEVK